MTTAGCYVTKKDPQILITHKVEFEILQTKQDQVLVKATVFNNDKTLILDNVLTLAEGETLNIDIPFTIRMSHD